MIGQIEDSAALDVQGQLQRRRGGLELGDRQFKSAGAFDQLGPCVLALLIEQLVDGAPQCWNDGATFLRQRSCDQNSEHASRFSRTQVPVKRPGQQYILRSFGLFDPAQFIIPPLLVK